MFRDIAGLAFVTLVFLAILVALTAVQPRTIPQCEEDEVVVGFGDFEHGYWDAYECVPMDDLPL